jgi:hypothetical protein
MAVSPQNVKIAPVCYRLGMTANSHNQETFTASRRYGSESEVEAIYGISRRTLQKNRLLKKPPNAYKFGRRVLYDLAEVEAFIRASGSKVVA